MKYQIFYTDSAKQDLKNIYRYICDSLVEPEIAEKLTDKIMKSIRSLDEMPQRYRLFDEEPWRSRGLRILPVNNYLIFYLSDEVPFAAAIPHKDHLLDFARVLLASFPSSCTIRPSKASALRRPHCTI